ncbi:hypothetical protein GWI33_005626 [Rhynchophorus ferrugineus]|uniref:Uncharacterized protein n=1 Tax=Rhynchophorus ferrugineus TaxID=354439 RepID=A0A834IH59_RHYFE|nr:hypothetical protein GWI33_005626 [Rhynchophorus ferrugineus]
MKQNILLNKKIMKYDATQPIESNPAKGVGLNSNFLIMRGEIYHLNQLALTNRREQLKKLLIADYLDEEKQLNEVECNIKKPGKSCRLRGHDAYWTLHPSERTALIIKQNIQHFEQEEIKNEEIQGRESTYWPTDNNKVPDLLDFYISKGISLNEISTESLCDLTSDNTRVLLTVGATILRKTKKPNLTNKYTDWDKFRLIQQEQISLKLRLKCIDDLEQ